MKRRGISVLETIVAAAMMTALLTICLKMAAVVVAQNRANRLRQTALCEVANTMERLAVLSWDELSSERIEQIRLEAMQRSVLDEPVVEVTVLQVSDSPEAKRIGASVRWRTARGDMSPPVKLVAWRYAPPEPTAMDMPSGATADLLSGFLADPQPAKETTKP